MFDKHVRLVLAWNRLEDDSLTSWLLIQSRSYASPSADEKIPFTKVLALTIPAPELRYRALDRADDACDSGADLLLDTSAFFLLASEAGGDGWAEAFLQLGSEYAHDPRGHHRQWLKESMRLVVQRLHSEGKPTEKGHGGGLVQR